MKKREIDKNIGKITELFNKMEPLESRVLKKWRALLVFFFSLGFLLAMLWVFYSGYGSQIYAETRYLKNISLVEYNTESGVGGKILSKPLIIPITEATLGNRQKIDLGNWNKLKDLAKEGLLIFQTADKKAAQVGDIITYNNYLLIFPGKTYKNLVLYNLLPERADLIWDKTMSADDFFQSGDVVGWKIGDIDVENKEKPILFVKKFHVKVK